MIKLGIFGDQSTSLTLLKQLKSMPGIEIVGIFFSGNNPNPAGLKVIASPGELMDISDAILLHGDKSVSPELIKTILRKSRHLYLKNIPNFSIKETRDLIDLEKEARVVTSLNNPFDNIPYFDKSGRTYEKPFLINLRTSFEGNLLKPSHELMLLITAINRIVQSSFKKLEIFSMNDANSQIMVNIRVEYKNGSVVNLTITQEKCPGYCEIFEPSKHIKFDIPASLYSFYPPVNQEIAAIEGFIRLIENQDIKGNSFDTLQNGVQIVHEIREHLRFNEIDF